MPPQRIPRILSLSVVFLIGFFLSMSCKESVSSPTAPGSATVSGTVVSGDADTGTSSEQAGGGLAGVTVRVLRTGQSAQTDGSGNFTLAGVPAGQQELQFSRGDIDARGTVTVTAGAGVAIIATILKRSTVVVAPRGNPNAPVTPGGGGGGGPAVAEIEGLVTAVGSSSLTVFDERLGLVVINVTSTTVIRRGGTDITLSQILVGMRVHVKATLTGGTYTAIEIILQNEITKTVPTSSPTAAATGTPTSTATPTSVPPTSTPTSTATPTSIPPTHTPTSTATPTSVPPTHTPMPTSTSTPTP